jgi:hypothetical protein
MDRQVVGAGTGEWDAICNCNRIARVLVDEAQLILGICVEELGVVLVMRARVVEKAKIAPSNLLDCARRLLQVRRVRAGPDDQIGRHGRLEIPTSVESPLLPSRDGKLNGPAHGP